MKLPVAVRNLAAAVSLVLKTHTACMHDLTSQAKPWLKSQLLHKPLCTVITACHATLSLFPKVVGRHLLPILAFKFLLWATCSLLLSWLKDTHLRFQYLGPVIGLQAGKTEKQTGSVRTSRSKCPDWLFKTEAHLQGDGVHHPITFKPMHTCHRVCSQQQQTMKTMATVAKQGTKCSKPQVSPILPTALHP